MTEGPPGIHCAEVLGESEVAFSEDVASLTPLLENREIPGSQNRAA